MLGKLSKQISYLIVVAMFTAVLAFTPTVSAAETNDMFALVGYATLNGGTTGGQGGIVKYASTGAEIEDLLYAKYKGQITQPLTIYVQGTITPSNSTNTKIDVKDVKDISIIGVGTKGEFNGIGIKITKSSNIIIQNLKIHHVNIGDKDCISIEGPASNIWVDHCELYNDLDHSKDYYDGLLDAKADSEYMTFSWNYLHHSYKTSLVGSSDSDNFDRKITYHHNYIQDCNSRLPSYRYGTGHIFNNYYVNNLDTGINSRMGAKLKIENNHFENFKDPIGYWYSNEAGYWDVSNNKFVNCTGSMPTTSTCSFNPPYEYAHALHPVDEVKSIVTQYAGLFEGDIPIPTPITPTPVTPTPATPTPTAAATGTALYGDLNKDNTVNSTDLTVLKRYILKINNFDSYQMRYSDLNLDSVVDSTDLTILKRYLLKIISTLPIGDITPTPIPTIIPTPTSTQIPQPSHTPTQDDIILEPNGPMNLQQAIDSIQPGNAIYLKSGTYSYSQPIIIAEGNNGTQSAMKKIFAYGSDKPVIDFSAMAENSANRGVILAGNYWHFKGVTIQEAGDNGMLLAGSNNKIEACTFAKNHDSGLQLSRYNTSYNSIDQWPSNNLIVDCISRENMDSGREDADGYAPKLTSGRGNVFRNCKALYNCDDGWDMYTKSETGAIGIVTLENCEAIGNGKFVSGGDTGGDGNGYKLGDDTAPVPHILKNCVANDNKKHGFTGNGNPAKIILENCSGSGNGQKLFDRLENAEFINNGGDPGTGDPGTGDPGTGDPGTGDPVNQDGKLTLQAENASFGGGYISGNYVELDGKQGSYIEWSFNMSQAENASAEWYFNTSNTVKFNVTVNGVDAGGVKSFDAGRTVTSRSISFPSGNVKLRIEVSESASGPIKIDNLVIKSYYASGS